MKKIIFSGFLMFALLSVSAYAQHRVTGTVTDASDGSTLPGVSVMVKGTTTGTITDVDGEYQINTSSDAVLEFSFVGMTTIEVPVDGRNIVDVSMTSSLVGLEEVIVVAYGTTKRESFTGSASVVDSEKISNMPINSVEQALSGSAPGIQIGNTSGQPGSAVQMRIRGTGSISSSNEPLYVIDGVPVASGSLSQNTSFGGNALSALNPSDIESVSILKDAAAASLYGSRAANGVVLITTKSGQEGKTQFNFKSSMGFNDFAVDFYPMASREDAYNLKHEGFANYGRFYLGMDDSDAAAYADDLMDQTFYAYDPERPTSDYDWKDEIFRTGVNINHEISASGGTENTRYFTSFSYLEQEGFAVGSDYDRITGRLNLEHDASEYLSFGVNTAFTRSKQNGISEGDGGSFTFVNPVFATQFYLNPLFPIYTEDGEYNEDIVFGNYPNIVKDIPLNAMTNNLFRTSNQVFAQANITPNLNFRTTFGFDANLQDEDRYWSPLSNDGETHNGYGHKRHRIYRTMTSSNILNYNSTFGEIHDLDVLLGYEIERMHDEKTSTEASNYPNASLPHTTVAADPLSANNWEDERKMISYLSRVNYTLDNTYYLSTSFRRDGSSTLGENERWGDFFSVSGSVRMTQLDFMENRPDWLDDLKVRASYGTNGTLPSSLYGHLPLYGFGFDYNNNPGMRYTQVPNEDLSWEKNNVINFGVDFTVFDRVTFDIEYYNRKTTDLLLQVPVSRVSGFSSTWQNVGEMENKGIELNVNSSNIQRANFNWTTSFNISRNINEIVKLYEGEDILDGSFILREGKSFSTLYLREWAGVDPEDGMGMWYLHDEDGNRTGTTKERTEARPVVAGNTDPSLTGGIYNSFNYRNFDLSFMFNYSIGGKMVIGSEYFYNDDGMNWQSTVNQRQVDDRWTPDNPNAENPRYVWQNPQETNFASTRRVYDNDFLRLKSLTFGYSLPNELTGRVGVDRMRLFFSGYNLLTFAATDDFIDPEVDVRGTYNQRIPAMKTLTFGVELNF